MVPEEQPLLYSQHQKAKTTDRAVPLTHFSGRGQGGGSFLPYSGGCIPGPCAAGASGEDESIDGDSCASGLLWLRSSLCGTVTYVFEFPIAVTKSFLLLCMNFHLSQKRDYSWTGVLVHILWHVHPPTVLCWCKMAHLPWLGQCCSHLHLLNLSLLHN